MKPIFHFRKLTKRAIILIVLYIFIQACEKAETSTGFNLDLPTIPEPVEWTVLEENSELGPEYTCKTKKVKWGPQYSTLTSFDPQGGVIWPGAILKYESIRDGGYIPISGDRKPLTISASLPNLKKQAVGVENPSLSSTRSVMAEILGTLNAGNTPAHIIWKSQEIYSKKHFNLAVGANYGSWFFDVSANFEYDKSAILSRYLLEFEQVYYSVDVDIPPSGLENWFEQIPNKGELGSYSPVYVSSVNYGRKVFFLITSQTLSSGLAADLKADFNSFVSSGGTTISTTLDKLIKEKSIQAFIMGGSAPLAAQVVSNPAALKQYIDNGANYSPQSPGIPLSYTLRFVTDNSIAKLALYDEFVIRECVQNDGYNIVRFTPKYTPNGYIPPYGNKVESPMRLFPSLVRGDGKIGGTPQLSAVCSLYISEDKKKLIAWIEYTVEELGWDKTKGSDKWPFTVYTAPSGKKIDKILTKSKSSISIKDENGAMTNMVEFPPSTSELVQQFSMLGLTGASDLGDKNDRPDQSNLRVWFNVVKLQLKDE